MRILVIQTSWLGDNILTTPLVRNLSAVGEVDVLTLPRWSEVHRNSPYVHRILTFDKHGAHRGISGLTKMAKALASQKYDAAVIPQKWFRSGLLSVMAKIPVRVGFADAPARMFYTVRVPYPRREHELVRILQLARPLGIEPQIFAPQLFPAEENFAKIAPIVEKLSPPAVAVAPGSAWETKRYPYFGEVVRILARSGIDVVCIGTKSEENLLRETAGEKGKIFVSNSILDSAALMSKISVVVANDSGAGHIGSAVGTPVVSVFGPTVPQQGFYPWGERNRIVQIPLECRPCSPHGPKKCPLGHHRCMRDIPPEKVAAAVFEVLRQNDEQN